MAGINTPYRFQYENVLASQSNVVLGGTGAKGDYLHKLIITVNTAATAALSITDGSLTAKSIMPNSPGGGIGVYVIDVNAISQDGAWKVTTGAGVEVMAIGIFSA